MNCQIEFNLDGHPGRVSIEAEGTFDALLAFLDTLPESGQVKVVVRLSPDDPLNVLLAAKP